MAMNRLDNRPGLFLLNKVRKAYSRRSPFASRQQSLLLNEVEAKPEHFDLQGTQAECYIKQLLLEDSPCMISRLGSTEMETVLTYLNIQSSRKFLSKLFEYVRGEEGYFLSYHARVRMPLAGVFPNSEEMVARYATQILKDARNIDVLGSWLADDSWLQQEYFPNAVKVPLRDLEPFRSKDPWSSLLKDKSVLVIHPFEESIRKQYERRELLFENKHMLPNFELKTLRAVQSIAGSSGGFSDWFDAFDFMCEQISAIDFEIAIIGAGGYGLPLASFIKTTLKKKAVHLGGATQIMFGIKGKKWVENPSFSGLFNEHWISPSRSETPESFKSVEGGCYW